MMSREEAIKLVRENVSNEKIVLHMIAVSAIMKALARKLGKDEKLWELVGLLHDVDYEKTRRDPERHGLEAESILGDKASSEVIRAIKAHNFENTGIAPENDLEKALIAADAVSGLIIASALVMPNRRLEEIRVETLERKFRQKDFARNVSRERIRFCEQLGMRLRDFFEISLNALKEISSDLGL